MKKKVLNDLFDYGLKIYQIPGYFKFSLDSILLAEYVKITNKTTKILDLCCGNASIPLILSTKTKAFMEGVEIQKEIYDLAIESIHFNKLDDQIKMYNANVTDISNWLKGKKYDIITCNPPYFKVDSKDYINDETTLAIARHEIKATLEDIFRVVTSFLNTKGEFYLVHRASRLDEIINLGYKYDLNVKNIELIKTKKNSVPYIVLVRCVKDSNSGLKINDVKCIENLKTYKNLFKEAK